MSKLGIIAGKYGLPQTIAKSFDGEVFVAAIKNHAKLSEFEGYESKEFNIGHVGKILKFFKTNDIKNIVLAGSINRFNFSEVSVDFEGAKMLTKIMTNKILGDDKLLRIVANYIESKGFKVLSALDFIKNEVANTITKARKAFLNDIEYGKEVVSKLGDLDIGQAAIVERGVILGVEAAEGTDNLIKRCASLTKDKNASILVKMMKPNQDRRLDIPVIGPETVKNAISANMAGIAIEKDSVILIEPERIASLADDNDFFIHLF